MTNRVAEVNKVLKAQGYSERLRAGRGYYYFSEGTTSHWHETAVYVFRANELSVAQWMDTFHDLRKGQ